MNTVIKNVYANKDVKFIPANLFFAPTNVVELALLEADACMAVRRAVNAWAYGNG